MKKSTKLVMKISLAFLGILVLVMSENIVVHEELHKVVAIHNGCVEWETKYFPQPYFKCIRRDKILTEEDSRFEENLDSMNEIVGYNTGTLAATILFAAILICITIIETKKLGNDI